MPNGQQECRVSPASIKKVVAVVRGGEPEPSTGRKDYVWTVFGASNPDMHRELSSKGI